MISKKIQEKIEKGQAHITTNEDLSKFGYYKGNINRYGKRIWLSGDALRRKKEITKKWSENHLEENRKKARKYCQEHVEEKKEYNHNNAEVIRKKGSEYYQDHVEERKEYGKIYNKSLAGREVMRRCMSKRRELGFELLNEWFPDSEAHHVDKERIIYIPEEMHRSVPHNIWTGKGMKEINALAFKFLEEGEFNLISVSLSKPKGKPREEITWEQEEV